MLDDAELLALHDAQIIHQRVLCGATADALGLKD